MSLCDVVLSPTSVKFPNLMSIETEEMVGAQRMDAVVLIGGWEKAVHGQLMGAVSAGLPAVMLVAGPMMTGRHRGERLGDRVHVAGGAHADHRLPLEAHLERVRHGDDLHDVGLEESLHALADGGLREADLLGDRGVGLAPVMLEQPDDGLAHLVEGDR